MWNFKAISLMDRPFIGRAASKTAVGDVENGRISLRFNLGAMNLPMKGQQRLKSFPVPDYPQQRVETCAVHQ
ncbi:hypothetical protein [Rhizobium sp. CECT 9324]|uniref:hypothetical protein n=1 Tax=Rhizobium sp. CECT 9324 TaxID=2845820 RepID=UPI001E3E216D|nr:hypothetical protein [Rhizobium sp. CECT 9324]